MAKGDQRSNKMTKKPKKEAAPSKLSALTTSDRPSPPVTTVPLRGKLAKKKPA